MTAALEELVGEKQLSLMFGLSAQTIAMWRKREKDPLPFVNIPGSIRNTIRFNTDEVAKWADRNGRVFDPTIR